MLTVLTDNIIDQNHFVNIIRTSLSNSVISFVYAIHYVYSNTDLGSNSYSNILIFGNSINYCIVKCYMSGCDI